MKLKPLERGVLDFLIEKADDKNLVLVNDLLKEEYRSFLLEVSQLNISKTVAAKAVSKLASIGLILAEPMVRGLYRINPKYFWSGSEKKRMMVLEQTIIERLNAELPVNHLIDIPMEVFLENVDKKNNFG
jgi:predicted transcriptional regulator